MGLDVHLTVQRQDAIQTVSCKRLLGKLHIMSAILVRVCQNASALPGKLTRVSNMELPAILSPSWKKEE